MKAAVCNEFGADLELVEVELEGPAPGEVTVRLEACAICHSDVAFMRGAWGGTLPAVYGHEAAGRIEAVGDGVGALAPGDRVVLTLIRSCGRCLYCRSGEPALCETSFPRSQHTALHFPDGRPIHQGLRTAAFAERTTVDASQVVPVGDEIGAEVASLLACGVITGVGAVVNTAKVAFGSSVAVVGTGGVGLNVLQGARLVGAATLVAVDLSDYKLEAARRFGATHGLNPARDDVAAGVRALTGGRGADYVFVSAGSAKAVEQGFELVRRGGTLVLVGIPPTGATVALDPVTIADSSLRVLGSKMGSTQPAVAIPALVELYRQGRLELDELVSARFSLGEVNDAVRALEKGEVLRPVVVF